MQSLLVRRPDHDERPVEAGDGAADEQEVVAAVHANHVEVADGDALVAVPAGHADALLGPAAAAVRGVGADRAALPRPLLDAVAVPQAAAVLPREDPGPPAALGPPAHLHRRDV